MAASYFGMSAAMRATSACAPRNLRHHALRIGEGVGRIGGIERRARLVVERLRRGSVGAVERTALRGLFERDAHGLIGEMGDGQCLLGVLRRDGRALRDARSAA